MTASSVDRNVDGLAIGYGRLMPDGSRAVNPFIDARGMAAATGITSTVTTWRSSCRRNSGKGAWAAARS
jgi:hypothetical protein